MIIWCKITDENAKYGCVVVGATLNKTRHCNEPLNDSEQIPLPLLMQIVSSFTSIYKHVIIFWAWIIAASVN